MSENEQEYTENTSKRVAGLLSQAESDVSRAQKIAEEIKKKHDSVEEVYGVFVELRGKIIDPSEGIEAILDKSNSLHSQISQTKSEAQDELNEINRLANSVSTWVSDMESDYEQFVKIKARVDDEDDGILANVNHAKNLQQEILQLRDNSNSQLNQINEKATSAFAKTQEIEEFYTQKFLPLKGEIEDDDMGVLALLNRTKELKEDASTTFADIQTYKSQSEEHEKNSSKLAATISDLKNRSEEFKESIHETLKIVTDQALANSFDARKIELKDEEQKWLWHVIASSIVLAVVVMIIYMSQFWGEGAGLDTWKFWYRFVFTSPIIYYVYFASNNYTKTRDLLEKYAFKSAVALSLQTYTKLLRDNFQDEKNQSNLLDFTLRSIDMLYKEPYREVHKTIRFKIGNKAIDLSLEDIEMLAKDKVSSFAMERRIETEHSDEENIQETIGRDEKE